MPCMGLREGNSSAGKLLRHGLDRDSVFQSIKISGVSYLTCPCNICSRGLRRHFAVGCIVKGYISLLFPTSRIFSGKVCVCKIRAHICLLAIRKRFFGRVSWKRILNMYAYVHLFQVNYMMPSSGSFDQELEGDAPAKFMHHTYCMMTDSQG